MRSAMHAASELPGREGGPLIWMMHMHLNQKSDYDMIYEWCSKENDIFNLFLKKLVRNS